MEIKTILVPTDFSACADEALARATQLAKLVHADIHLLHAYELPTTVFMVEAPLSLPQEFYDRLRDGARKIVDERIARLAAEGVKATGWVVCDSPTRAILDAAAKTRADLIVMGTQGRTGMKHVLLGSVAERVVRLADCPVMTVKSAHDE